MDKLNKHRTNSGVAVALPEGIFENACIQLVEETIS